VQEASDQLQVQLADLQKNVASLRTRLDEGAKPVIPAAKEDMPSIGQPATPRRILWVDDIPSNNAYEIAQFKAEGIDILQATSTEEAMRILIENRLPVGAVITDMGRRENGQYRAKAGIQLIEAIRRSGIDLPVFVYSSAKHLERNRNDVMRAKGNGATSSPLELFEMVHKVIPSLHVI
jgi:CheY-like chemotaxis protein